MRNLIKGGILQFHHRPVLIRNNAIASYNNLIAYFVNSSIYLFIEKSEELF